MRSLDRQSEEQGYQHKIDGADSTDRAETSSELPEPHREGW